MPPVVYAILSALGAQFRSQRSYRESRTSLCDISWQSISEPPSDRTFDPRTASFGPGYRATGPDGGMFWSSSSPRPSSHGNANAFAITGRA